jgi:putative SOS response-associated peptidase YedK
MCGRYVSPDEASIEREFNLVHQEWQFPPSFNVVPTQQVPILREIHGERRGSTVRWGMIPFFARGEPPKYSTINARIETVETAASYQGPWKRGQRCLQFATGFYEWVRHEVADMIVRRGRSAGPAVPSAVPYEVGRLGNELSKSPRTM